MPRGAQDLDSNVRAMYDYARKLAANKTSAEEARVGFRSDVAYLMTRDRSDVCVAYLMRSDRSDVCVAYLQCHSSLVRNNECSARICSTRFIGAIGARCIGTIGMVYPATLLLFIGDNGVFLCIPMKLGVKFEH
jgi:hypothetical protein